MASMLGYRHRMRNLISSCHQSGEEEMTNPDNIPENTDENVLTGIHEAYTVSATTETETSEVDEIIVKNFLETLAEISLAIAIRNTGRQE